MAFLTVPHGCTQLARVIDLFVLVNFIADRGKFQTGMINQTVQENRVKTIFTLSHLK